MSESLTSKAVEIACSARDEIDKKSFVFGSVSPLEDCYQPNLSPDEDVCFLEHSRMISLLVDSGVDSVLIETMCSHQESVGAIKAIEKNNVKSWGISFTFMSDKEPGILLDGTSIKELIPYLEKASFVGVNCVSYFEIINQVKFLKNVLPEGMLIMSCGNIGQVDEVGGWINPENCQSNIYASHVMGWVKAGAGIVGGCCGTTPGTIAAMRKSIRSMN